MEEQISFIPWPGMTEEERADMEREAKKLFEYVEKQKKKKRNWENAFQRWSDAHGMGCDNTESYGCCGYGSMCDWCYDDPSRGKPCVRALNAMCREKGLKIDYTDRDFAKVWEQL